MSPASFCFSARNSPACFIASRWNIQSPRRDSTCPPPRIPEPFVVAFRHSFHPMMDISDFDYQLPDDLIAQQPLPQRDASRMLILDRATQSWRDSYFKDLPGEFSAGDVLVVNNTRVFPARLRGNRVPSGGSIELLLIRETAPKMWEALAKPARRLRVDDELEFAG